MPLLEVTDGTQRPAEKHPRGACYWAWHWSQPDRLGFESFEKAVSRIGSVGVAREWLGKLHELDASTQHKEAVAERIKDLS